MKFKEKGLILILSFQIISYIATYDVNIDMYFEKYLTEIYVNDEIADVEIPSNEKPTVNLLIKAQYGDIIKFKLSSPFFAGGGMGVGLSGYITLFQNVYSTDESNLWKISHGGFSSYLKNRGPKNVTFLGNLLSGNFDFTFTIPQYFIPINQTTVIKTNEEYSVDMLACFTRYSESIKDTPFFQIYEAQKNGTLALADDSSPEVRVDYQPQVIKYTSNKDGGYKDTIQFVIGNSVQILSNIGFIEVYVCWKGCEDCPENMICEDEECVTFKKMNCYSCSKGYSSFHVVEDGRTECWDNSIDHEGYYLDNNTNSYQACYETCRRCSTSGTEKSHNCEVCKDNFFFVFQTSDCVSLKSGYYLDKADNMLHKCSENCETCSDAPTTNSNNCLTCPWGLNLVEGNCKKEGAKIEVVDVPAKDILKKNVSEIADENVIVKGEDYNMQIYKTSKDDTVKKNALKNKLATVEMEECLQILRKQLGLKDDEDIIIAKIDKNVTNSTVNQVDFLLYQSDGTPIDYSICKETNITVNKPLIHPELVDMDKVKELSKSGFDVFDSNDKFFNDICSTYKSENGTDVVLSDRRGDFYQNVSFCEEGCEYNGFDVETTVAKCKCDPVGTPDEAMDNIEKVSLSSIENVFLSSIFSSNVIVAKCYKLAFSRKILFNLGFWVVGSLVLAQTILFIMFLFYGLDKLRNYMTIFFDNPPIKFSSTKVKTEPETNWDFFETSDCQNSQPKPLIGNNAQKNNYIIYPNNKKENTSRTNNTNKFLNIKAESILIYPKPRFSASEADGKTTVYTNETETNKFTVTRHSSDQSVNVFDEKEKYFKNDGVKLSKFYEKNPPAEEKKYHSKNAYLIPKNYEEMKFEEAMIQDTRPFCPIYWSFISEKQIIISTFCSNSFLDLRIIKIYIFFFSTSLDFTMNAFFYTDSSISELYYNNGVLDMVSSLPQTLYSCIIGCLIGLILSNLSDSKKKLESILKSEGIETKYDYENKGKKAIHCLKIKLFFFFVISFILSLAFWYYAICFCAVYHNTQFAWLYNSLTSTVISMFVPILTSFALAVFRYWSLKKKNKCLFRIYGILDFFI